MLYIYFNYDAHNKKDSSNLVLEKKKSGQFCILFFKCSFFPQMVSHVGNAFFSGLILPEILGDRVRKIRTLTHPTVVRERSPKPDVDPKRRSGIVLIFASEKSKYLKNVNSSLWLNSKSRYLQLCLVF